MKIFSVLLCLMCAVAVVRLPARAEPESPDPGDASAFVETVAARAIAILEDSSLDSDQRLSLLEQLTREAFDLETVAKLVLARNWRRFDEAQRAAFRLAFERYLAKRYGGGVDRYDREHVRVIGEQVEPRGDVTVETRLLGGSAAGIRVDYRLRKRDGAWRLIDVIPEGVSLVSSYRAQFKEVLANGGPDHLIKILQKKSGAPPKAP